jgi:predicted ArsR family transcriptional regulator
MTVEELGQILRFTPNAVRDQLRKLERAQALGAFLKFLKKKTGSLV